MLIKFLFDPRTIVLEAISLAGILLVVYSVLSLTYSLYGMDIVLNRPIEETSIVVTSPAITPLTATVNVKEVIEAIDKHGLTNCIKYLVIEFMTIAYLEKDLLIIVKNTTTIAAAYIKEFLRLSSHGEDVFRVRVSTHLASSRNVGINDSIIVYSVWTGYPYRVKVVDFIDEPGYVIYAPYAFVALVRGVSMDYASFIILQVRDEQCYIEVLGALAPLNTEKGLLIATALRLIERLRLTVNESIAVEKLGEIYALRLGIHRDIIMIASISISLLTIYACYVVGSFISSARRHQILVLRDLGLHMHRILAYYTLLHMLLYSLSAALAYEMTVILMKQVRFLGYPLTPCNDAITLMFSTIVLGVISWLGMVFELKRIYEA